MRLSSRRKTIAFFVALGVCLVAAAVALNVGWIILNWREGVLLFFGVIFFVAIIAGVILNTGFLVREIRRNEQHDSFINAVTHELKTPITTIRLYLETLQRRGEQIDPSQRSEFYRLMLQDTDRLVGTVEQVLKAGRAGHKSAGRTRVDVDFGRLVSECVDLARTRLHLDPEALQCQVANGSPLRVEGDPDELRTAVSNVLENAVKYSGDRVDVTVQVEAPDDKRVALRVTDRGIGIPVHELKRIFKRFYRVNSRSSVAVKGTGLGLFLVRTIARNHGGKVFARSAGEGQGTTVIMELPRAAA
jgi:two-component system, OmpR family, sensor histidine kinase SenX3